MSDVYVALHTGLRKRVALKLLRPSLRCDDYAVQRFLREGECAARVRHPNVVDVSDVGLECGVPYLVMELLEGETLAQRLANGGALDLESAVDLLLPIFDAVSAVHAAGVLHRDVKPANILLARAADGSLQPKLVDFGIARLPEHAADNDGMLGPLGTPHYMSPEQARGELTDERSDQYALASVLFELLTGREPFVGKTVESVLGEVSRGKFPRLRSVLPDVPLAFDELIARATAPKPSQRFVSVSDFAYALVPFASERTRRLFVTREERAGIYSAQLLSGKFRAEPLSDSTEVRSRAQARSWTPEPVSVAGSFVPGIRARSRRLRHLSVRVFGAAALLGVGLIAGFGVTHSVAEAERSAPQKLPPVAASALPPVAPQAATPVHTLRVLPPDATVSLDGVELPQKDMLGGEVLLPELSADAHELRVSAKGHVGRVLFFRGALHETTVSLDRRAR